MGQKVNPIGFRLGVIKTWESRWFSDKDYPRFLHEDIRVKKFVKKSLFHAGVSKIEIDRKADNINIVIHTARPGIVIGRKGTEVEVLKKQLSKLTDRNITIDIQEIRKPDLDAQLLAENISLQLIKRVSFRRAMKRAVTSCMKMGALGIKIACSGRLGGHEIARSEWYREGRVPLHTLRADVDYGVAEAKTTYGIIGVKIWIFKGDVIVKEAGGED